METLVVWIAAAILISLIFIPYLLKFRKSQKVGLAQKQEAESLGADKPVAQYPQIDYYKCIGCGACIDACPEHNVLGIVAGKASIINGLKCVGHGKCAEACPVEGIQVGLGDIKNRPDIPVLSDDYETNIPNMYIAGELAGLALIKNALSQGNKVVEKIASTYNKLNSNGCYDVLIVGAGPAGLSAALTAIKHELSYKIIDQQGAGGTILQYPRKKLVMTKPVEIPLYGWLKKPEYEKEELLDIWTKVEEKYSLNLDSDKKLENISKENEVFIIQTNSEKYLAKNVVLALGRRGTPRKLGVPGEDKPKVYYKLMDAESYQNEHVLIVGGGDSAVEAAIGLAKQENNTVTISYRKHKFFRIKTKNEERVSELIDAGRIKTLFNSNVTDISEGKVKIQTEESNIEIPNNFIFIFAGGEPPFNLLKKIGIAFGGEMQEN
jgi:putative YpdA family bacillithiol system oxidoreductase